MSATNDKLRTLIKNCERMVVFTGAGVSTESGVPDFRSPGGIWSRMSPIDFREFVSSEEARRESWRRKFSIDNTMDKALPNDGHKAIARLVEAGIVSAVITQNIDNLHQASGIIPDKIIELHGNASYAVCLSCGLRHELEDIRPRFLETNEPPGCRACGGMVKSATISFGQSMPEAEMARAEQETLMCDAFLVVGSSLQVYPAAGFPVSAQRNGAHLVILNREPTELDHYADMVINAEIGPVLKEVTDFL
ncbi:MAG: Sir2 family NAD-dependent protein deacetylase [Parvularculales bacterium]